MVMVYIDEAHANDIWPLGKHIDLPSHKTFEDRKNAATLLIEKFNFQIPILFDTMDNEFDKQYAVWPERYYTIENRKIEYISEPNTEFGYERNGLEWNLFRFKLRNEYYQKDNNISQ